MELVVLERVNNSEMKKNRDIRISDDYKATIYKHWVDFKYPLPRVD